MNACPVTIHEQKDGQWLVLFVACQSLNDAVHYAQAIYPGLACRVDPVTPQGAAAAFVNRLPVIAH